MSLPPIGYDSRGEKELQSSLFAMPGSLWIFAPVGQPWFAVRGLPDAGPSNPFTLVAGSRFRSAEGWPTFQQGDYRRPEGIEPVNETVNLYFGSDPAFWRHGIKVFNGVRFRDVYPGVDVTTAHRGPDHYLKVECDAGVDPSVIRFYLEGDVVKADSDEIVVRSDSRTTRLSPYKVTQLGRPLDYTLIKSGLYQLSVAIHDRSMPLVIERVIPRYLVRTDSPLGAREETFNGSNSRLATDKAGNTFVAALSPLWGAGSVSGLYPANETSGWTGGINAALITKYDGNANRQFTTFFGGFKHDLQIALDQQGDLLIAGRAAALAPVHPSQIPSWDTETHILLLKMSGTGRLAGSHLPASRAIYLRDLVVDHRNWAHLVGTCYGAAPQAPRSVSSSDSTGNYNALLLTFDTTRKNLPLVFSAAIGGGASDEGVSATVSSDGFLFLAAKTSTHRPAPTTPGAIRAKPAGRPTDYLIAKLDPAGDAATSVKALTYYGGTGDFLHPDDELTDLAVNRDGSLWVVGSTVSPYFPVTADAYRTQLSASRDGFLSRLSADLTKVEYSTRFGGRGDDWIDGIAQTNDGSLVVVGRTTSADFPLVRSMKVQPRPKAHHGFGALFDFSGVHLFASTLLWTAPSDMYRRASATLAVDSESNWLMAGESPMQTELPLRGAHYSGDSATTVLRITPCQECRHPVESVSDRRLSSSGTIEFRGRLKNVSQVFVNGRAREFVRKGDNRISLVFPATERVVRIEIAEDGRRMAVRGSFGSVAVSTETIRSALLKAATGVALSGLLAAWLTMLRLKSRP